MVYKGSKFLLLVRLVVLCIEWKDLQYILGSSNIEESDLRHYIVRLVHRYQDKDLYISYFYMPNDMDILHY